MFGLVFLKFRKLKCHLRENKKIDLHKTSVQKLLSKYYSEILTDVIRLKFMKDLLHAKLTLGNVFYRMCETKKVETFIRKEFMILEGLNFFKTE